MHGTGVIAAMIVALLIATVYLFFYLYHANKREIICDNIRGILSQNGVWREAHIIRALVASRMEAALDQGAVNMALGHLEREGLVETRSSNERGTVRDSFGEWRIRAKPPAPP